MQNIVLYFNAVSSINLWQLWNFHGKSEKKDTFELLNITMHGAHSDIILQYIILLYIILLLCSLAHSAMHGAHSDIILQYIILLLCMYTTLSMPECKILILLRWIRSGIKH